MRESVHPAKVADGGYKEKINDTNGSFSFLRTVFHLSAVCDGTGYSLDEAFQRLSTLYGL